MQFFSEKIIFSEYLKKISYFHVFFPKKIIFHFLSKKKDHIFGKKKYHLSRYYKKDNISVQFFWKDHLFRRSGRRKYCFPYSVNYVTNTEILELRIFSGSITSDCGFMLRLLKIFTIDTEEYYLRCHKVNDAKAFKNLVCSLYIVLRFELTNLVYVYYRLAHLTGVFKEHADSVLYIIRSD